MPTAAKLIAAVAFALLGYLAAGLGKPLLPDGTQSTWFAPFSAAVGAICGWMVLGGLVGSDYRRAAESGIRTMATMLFYALAGFSAYEMVLQSMKMRFDGPVEALQGMFDIAFGYLKLMLNPGLILTLLVGGVLAGLVTEWSSRRWR